MTRTSVATSVAANGKLSNYWMGLKNTSDGWRWPDGSSPDNFVNDGTPYGHWASGFYTGWVGFVLPPSIRPWRSTASLVKRGGSWDQTWRTAPTSDL